MSDDFTLDGVEPGDAGDDFPIGTNVCVIEDFDPGHAKTGTPQLRVQFRVVTGDNKGRVTSDWLFFTQAAAGLVLTKITAAGVEPPKGVKGGEAYANALGPLLLGRHVEIVTRAEEYNGETRVKVKAWKLPPEALRAAPVANGASSNDTDEDIPF